MRNANAIAGVADALESCGFRGEKAKRSRLTSPNSWSLMDSLETGYEPEYPMELTPVNREKVDRKWTA